MKRRGFSLIELLVVIAIIGLLLALTLVGVQQSREAARKTQCLSNLRQIGVALHSYHSSHRKLPPAVIWGGPPGEPLGAGQYPVGVFDRVALGRSPDTEPDRVYANWLVMLLADLGQGTLYNAYDFNRPVADAANERVRVRDLSVLKCPSDSYNETPYLRDLLAGGRSNSYARGNYAMNVGPNRACFHELQPGCKNGFHVGDADLAGKNMTLWGSGVGGINVSQSFDDVPAGLSRVVAVDEIRSGIHELDPRGSWALGFIGASMTARHGVLDFHEDASGPNNQYRSADDIVGCTRITEILGEEGLRQKRMPCYVPAAGTPEVNGQATARSMHAGGVHVLMLDGSAHFVSDAVNPEVWFHMHCRDGDKAAQLPF